MVETGLHAMHGTRVEPWTQPIERSKSMRARKIRYPHGKGGVDRGQWLPLWLHAMYGTRDNLGFTMQWGDCEVGHGRVWDQPWTVKWTSVRGWIDRVHGEGGASYHAWYACWTLNPIIDKAGLAWARSIYVGPSKLEAWAEVNDPS